jgi:outer membrane lipoprotein LolB
MKRYFFLILIFIGLLSGCAHQTLAPVIHGTQAYQQQLSQLHEWQLEGKIGVHHADKVDSAALQWKQDDDHFDIFLTGPLGAGATRLTGTPESLVMLDNDGEHSTTSNLQQLIQQRLGWTFPVEQLPQWILGATDNPRAEFNPDHTLAGFEQDGWDIRYLSYQTTGEFLLPEKIVLTQDDLRVTLVIKSWNLP